MISISRDVFPLAEVFTISRGSRTQAEVITARIERDGYTGWGECVPYARYGETLDSVTQQIQTVPHTITRSKLSDILPAGAARFAVDSALWDLEAKTTGIPIWNLAGLSQPLKPELTCYTLSLDTPQNMELSARKNAHRPILKIKLGTPNDMERVEAVRRGAPDAKIVVDANEGWDADIYSDLAPHLVRLGVALVEQPLPAGKDDLLAEIERPLPVCADESCHDRASLPDLIGKYDVINIKLDKTGGLTEALALKEAAINQGFKIMVGCMVGSSLAMAPATVVAQGALLTDLDGPLLLAKDRETPLHFDHDGVHPPTPALWG